jgi:molybdopterin-guanine dinucleotide biosynthesis protein
VWVEAHRLAASPKVTLRMDQLRAAKEAERRMQAACLSQFVVEGWKQLAQRKIVHQDGTVEEIPPAVRTRNLELIAKHLGMFVERIETADVSDRSAGEIEDAIRARLALYPK